jgi:hypothetical protein
MIEAPGQTEARRRLLVFLCHSSADKPIARHLYSRLKADGFAPWLDVEDLIPGQDWQEEIPAVVRACHAVVVCLSRSSVTKEGYMQKEIRIALDTAEEKPPGTIFLIPARIEEVEVPVRLRTKQWVNLFNEDGYDRLLRALKTRARDLGITVTPSSAASPSPAEQAARRYQEELAIASSLHKRLMEVPIPEVPFARVTARSLSAKESGGDFFDVVSTEDGLAIVLAEVSGKTLSAALLGSMLQAMVYAHLTTRMTLPEIATSVNRFLSEKSLGEKFATLIVVRVRSNGELEYVNCGHISPLLVSHDKVARLEFGNLPVGLLADATYESSTCQLLPGDRLIVVTVGVTEAENSTGEFFENERLEAVAAKSKSLGDIFSALDKFRGDTPVHDDCTVVELLYAGVRGRN